MVTIFHFLERMYSMKKHFISFLSACILVCSLLLNLSLICQAAAPRYSSTPPELTINPYITLSKNTNYQLNPTLNGMSVNYADYTYEVSNPKVVQVNQTGLVTALKKGNSRITITSKTNEDASCSIRIYVGKRASKLRLNATRKTIYVDNYFMLKAQISPYRAAIKKVRFTSSNPDIAKVSSKGKITGISEGSATITVATIDGSNLSRTCYITVLEEEEEENTEDYDFFSFDADAKSSGNSDSLTTQTSSNATSNARKAAQ